MVGYRFWNPRNQQKCSIKKWFILRYVYHQFIEEIGRGIKISTEKIKRGDPHTITRMVDSSGTKMKENQTTFCVSKRKNRVSVFLEPNIIRGKHDFM